jgi:hypothetical protein
MPNFDEGMVIRFLVLATKFVRGIKGESGNIPQIATTPRGRTRAAELLMVNPYNGPAPLFLDNCKKQVHDQSHMDAHPPAVELAVAPALQRLIESEERRQTNQAILGVKTLVGLGKVLRGAA